MNEDLENQADMAPKQGRLNKPSFAAVNSGTASNLPEICIIWSA
jgi:hypothetical protein